MELENLTEITPDFIEMSQPEVIIPSADLPTYKKSAASKSKSKALKKS
jgi:hypothetical protein